MTRPGSLRPASRIVWKVLEPITNTPAAFVRAIKCFLSSTLAQSIENCRLSRAIKPSAVIVAIRNTFIPAHCGTSPATTLLLVHMGNEVLLRICESYGLEVKSLLGTEKGYRNRSYIMRVEDNDTVNFILYKN